VLIPDALWELNEPLLPSNNPFRTLGLRGRRPLALMKAHFARIRTGDPPARLLFLWRNDCQRMITLGTVSMIKIPYRGAFIECTTEAEAKAVLDHLNEMSRTRIAAAYPSFLALAGATSRWTPQSFFKFVDSVGDAQRRVLSLLLRKTRVTDEELRKALGVESNQALAGILSGISKQAGALNISARSVFIVEDERRGGELLKTYAVAPDFLRVADEMNWVDE